jgi:cell shape-determining protein MreC
MTTILPSPFDKLRARKRRGGGGAWMLLLGLLVLMAAVYVLRGPLTGALYAAVHPLLGARFAGSAQTLATEGLVADRNALYQETLDLKARLGRTDVSPHRVLAGVVLRPPASPYDTLVIDAGSRHGVVVGDRVSAGGTTMLGTVQEVFDTTARVLLYSAPGAKYEGLLHPSAPAGAVPVSVEGQGGGSMRAQVPTGTTVAVGDEVLLPGIAGGITARVAHYDHDGSESYITLYFALPIDPQSLRYVEVWK